MIKIWNRPKVYILSDDRMRIAHCDFYYFKDTKTVRHAARWNNGSFVLSDNQTFDQAVNEWVENYVKRTFEPIVLPEDSYNHTFFDKGWAAFRDQFLRQNKNILIEDVQGD